MAEQHYVNVPVSESDNDEDKCHYAIFYRKDTRRAYSKQ